MRRFMILPALVLASVALFTAWNHRSVDNVGPLDRELAHLQLVRDHAPEGSATRYKAEAKMARIERHKTGAPGFEAPEQFARIINEMRIPADRNEPEYPAGYMVKEMRQAQANKRIGSRDLEWRSHGPGNVAGRARAIVVDPDDSSNSTWYLGTAGGGVWMTSNAGQTWQPLTDDFPVLSCQSLAMAESNHDIMYVGTGESYYNIDTINGNGILKTTDRGQTWTHLASTVDNPSFNNVSRIIIDPTDPDIVVVTTTVGRYKESIEQRSSIFKTTDGGDTWYEVFASTELGGYDRVKKVQQIIADPGNFNRQYAAVDEGGILRSLDAGENWDWVNNGITDFFGRFELAIFPGNTMRIFAAAEGTNHSELWMTNDGGDNWVETQEYGEEPGWLGAQGWYDNAITCHPSNANIVYVGGVRLWKITLNGSNRSTEQMSVGNVHVDHHGLMVLDDGFGDFRLLNTNDGGIGVSGNGDQNWTAPRNGLITTQFYGVDKRPGASAYCGGMQDNGTWFSEIDPEALDPWTFGIGGDGYETSWHFDDPQRMIGGYQYNGLQRTLDGGQSWDSATNGLDDVGSGSAPFITKIAKSNLDPDLLFAIGASGVWRSTNFGGSWSLISIPESTWGSNSSFRDVRISRAEPDVVWAGSRMDDSAQMHVSTNGGLSFNPVTNYTDVTMGGISGLATHPSEPGTAYVLFSFAERPKILRTTDYGVTWTDLTGFNGTGPSSNGFPDVAVYDLQVFSDDPNHMWVGTEIGLVETLDGGMSWSLADNGLPAVGVWSLTEVEDEVVIGTHGRGIWSVKMPSLAEGKFYRPLINDLYQAADGMLTIDMNLRSDYDSTQVFVDGAPFTTLPANDPLELVLLQLPVTEPGTRTVFARAFQDGESLDSLSKSAQVIVLQEAQVTYVSDFNSGGNDFSGDFSITSYSGFSNPAIHSPHPYSNDANYTYMLTVPIKVAQSSATVSFDEVVLVEPGESGSQYGDNNFWDYVVVEGSLDGSSWVPLADGYDSNDNTAWTFGSNGNSSMYRNRVIDLLDTFQWNDTVLLRFRLYSDGWVNGWGWAIDNLVIQDNASPAPDHTPAAKVNLAQNVPNPFNPSTTISFSVPSEARVKLQVFDVRGHLVRNLVDEIRPAGEQQVMWNGRDDRGAGVASGVYFYRLDTGGKSLQRRMLLIK